MSLALIALLPFVGAVLVGLLDRLGRNKVTLVAALATLTALMGIIGHIPAVLGGQTVVGGFEWLPALGLNVHFMLDGLGLLFALLILGVGLLIILYARFYLTENPSTFLAGLLAFQGAMLGIVISDNILLLLVFWELTSISSFLLIGYLHRQPQARQGARMALAVTGAGGLALMAGLLMLGHIAGSFDLSQMVAVRDVIQADPMYLPALVLILLGAFTKSAQMPFHFWLPHAMAAPTPVSAYLHSATMVKAGIFLLARLWPVLTGTEAWFYLVATTGLLTMLYGAKVALFKDDLKAILAYSTISHLGLITFLLGLGTKEGAVAALFHILCHASFKAALFMVAGIIDHHTHSRDIRKLGGLRHVMPITFGLVVVASLSMAGIPPLNGFLSKEMALAAAVPAVWLGNPWVIPIAISMGALLSVAYSLRFLWAGFFGQARSTGAAQAHDPRVGLWAAPAILAALVILIGLMPMTLAAWLITAATAAVTGMTGQVVPVDIYLWHGLHSPALWMSLFAVLGGVLALDQYAALRPLWDRFARGDGKKAYDWTLATVTHLARGMQDVTLSRYLAIAVATAVIGSLMAVSGTASVELRPLMAPSATVILFYALLILALAAVVFFHRQRVLALLLTGGIGLIVSLGFVYFSAPDLALTQISVEVVTVILMLQSLSILPKSAPPQPRHAVSAVIAVAAGLGVGALAYAMMLRVPAFDPISAFHLAQSVPGAGGKNAVNTIIVDFRGYDTYGEIIVLGIAALIIAALVETLVPRNPKTQEPPATQMMLVVAMRFLLPLILTIGVYLYLRGHNQPGGGFVAGLVFAIGFILQYIASGWRVAAIPAQAMIATGMLIATATGIGSWMFGRAFLTSAHGHMPLFAGEEWATAALFDLGILICVFGAVMQALVSMAQLRRR